MTKLEKLEKFIKLNKLEKEFTEFSSKPIWYIDWADDGDMKILGLFKNNKLEATLSDMGEFDMHDYLYLIYWIAKTMKCLVSEKQFLNTESEKQRLGIHYNKYFKRWTVSIEHASIDNNVVIDSQDNAVLIAHILNSSDAFIEWMGLKNEE